MNYIPHTLCGEYLKSSHPIIAFHKYTLNVLFHRFDSCCCCCRVQPHFFWQGAEVYSTQEDQEMISQKSHFCEIIGSKVLEHGTGKDFAEQVNK